MKIAFTYILVDMNSFSSFFKVLSMFQSVRKKCLPGFQRRFLVATTNSSIRTFFTFPRQVLGINMKEKYY